MISGSLFRHAVRGALLLSLVASVPAAAQDDSDRDDMRQELTDDMVKAGDLRRQTEQGKNLSEMRLGLFAIHLLNEMARDDSALYGFLHRDDHSTIGYLEDVFQYHSAEEMVALEALRPEPHRQVAHCALETLRHIPSDGDPPADQERDRRQLAGALAQLEAALKTVTDAIPR